MSVGVGEVYRAMRERVVSLPRPPARFRGGQHVGRAALSVAGDATSAASGTGWNPIDTPTLSSCRQREAR
jgi:hypothetical protein